jgi:hypothetical protein
MYKDYLTIAIVSTNFTTFDWKILNIFLWKCVKCYHIVPTISILFLTGRKTRLSLLFIQMSAYLA